MYNLIMEVVSFDSHQKKGNFKNIKCHQT